MRYMVVSDIHGDFAWASKAVEVFEQEKADRLVILGDILYHGPRNDLPEGYAPKKVIPLLNGIKDKIIAVRGNCDAEVDQMVLDFPIMDDYRQIDCDGKTYVISHGHVYYPGKFPENMAEGAVFLSGHTHIVRDEVVDGVRCMNPGSPSIPKENSAPSYILIDNGEALLKSFS